MRYHIKMHRAAFSCRATTAPLQRINHTRRPRAVQNVSNQASALESQILSAIKDVKGRGKEGLSEEQQSQLQDAVEQLESVGGVTDPTTKPDVLDGRWRLLYTSRPGSASPIQRAFTGTEQFKIYQEVKLAETGPCRVNNVVEFGDHASVGVLTVEAMASTGSRPLQGFTPRKGAGLALFGKSSVEPPAKDNMRIDFQFDQAAFDFKALPFNIPYPVPFRQLGDETKGWIDITYMNEDGTFRLTRGNKGTLFVLVKEEEDTEDLPPVDALLSAIEAGEDGKVVSAIEELKGSSPTTTPAKEAIIQGTWRQIWSEQAEDANPLQKRLSGNKSIKNWQIIDGEAGTLENKVDLGIATVRALATCEAASGTRTSVSIDRIVLEVLGQQFNLEVKRDSAGFVDWLYVDERVRVSTGNRGSTFVHRRETP
eukprot:jgi/Ulvmu1/4749/UM020_0033.1